jgi:hypothetical protein
MVARVAIRRDIRIWTNDRLADREVARPLYGLPARREPGSDVGVDSSRAILNFV